ncbi:DEAD/DEAH box helicase family protein [Prosthecobacter sp.]|uniref:type I restriction endonuclease subunit R n=1 Tax=Prosthecobacter sp. TaxID=1965333 RepID=UPI003784179E
MPPPNQNPEQLARDRIDAMLEASGWVVQDKKKIHFAAGPGIAVREYPTDTGPADYVLFVNQQACGVIEAKKEDLGQNITTVEDQTSEYAHAKLKWVSNSHPLRFLYESTGLITRFTDGADPKPRSREVFSFHRPETLLSWLEDGASLRARLAAMPLLNPGKLPAAALGLRGCQEVAVTNLEVSLQAARPRALIQMATGSGKTFTAITEVYRLLKFGKAKRILFLVDTKNLGEQAEQEFMAFTPSDDNRRFTELYTVQRLKSSFVPKDAQVCICTIQRLYSILKGEDLDDAVEELSPAEQLTKPKKPMPVVYEAKVPPEFFDFVIIDECHRSIYNLWQQVLDYFDAFLIGLTATPDSRTFGFFKNNVVSDYSHEKAVADGVNVGNETYLIETEVTATGTRLVAKQPVEHRERVTRKRRWEQQDEDAAYTAKQLDDKVVVPDQIRLIVRTFRDKLPEIFPGRTEVPKTLVFAKTDSHADDIIQIIRDEFGESNAFCKKITYKAEEDPKSVLAQFRNDYHPRIAVTVDMIATGTDVKPLECLLFMRDVKSRNYFEQMKGRGTRTLDMDDLRKVTPSAVSAKTHYVIVDAIGVTKSLKTASTPLITKTGVPLKDLAMGVLMGASDTDTVSSLAGRLARLNKQLDKHEHERIAEKSGGVSLSTIISSLIAAIDGDNVEAKALELAGQPAGTNPGDANRDKAQAQLVKAAANVFNGELIELIDTIRRDKEQKINHDHQDTLLNAAWTQDAQAKAEALTQEFSQWLQAHKDELAALTIFYDQPYRRREITFAMLGQVMATLRSDAPRLAPLRVYQAYQHLDESKAKQPLNELTALISLIRHACGLDAKLTAFDDVVRKNFQTWIMAKHNEPGPKFTEAQVAWLNMIRDHMLTSFHFERDDLDMAPFDAQGGLGKMYQLFGERMDGIIEELNEVLVA